MFEIPQMAIIIWVVVAGIAIFLEANGGDFTAICFALGAFVALGAKLVGANFVIQCIVFLVASFIFVVAFKPLFTKFLGVNRYKTNVDAIVDMEGVVIEDIDSSLGTGRVKIGGLDWKAQSQSGELIAQGKTVKVLDVQGVTLSVVEIT